MSVRKKSYIKVFFANFCKFLLRIILFPFVVVYFFEQIKLKKKSKEKVAVFNMSQLDSLSGIDFENFLKDMFEKLGYNVQVTKASHDYGADLLVSKNGTLAIVQAKCYSKTVGIKAIQEVVSAKCHYGATDAFVATNNFFSKDAEILALENGVKLIDRTVIEKMIAKYDIKIEKTTSNFSALSKNSVEEINQKFPYMI